MNKIYSSVERDIGFIKTKTRFYQVNPGNNYFCCSGLFSTGSSPKKLIITTVFYNIPIILFINILIFGLSFSSSKRNWLIFVTVFFWILTNITLFTTSLMDPGRIRRNPFESTTFFKAHGEEIEKDFYLNEMTCLKLPFCEMALDHHCDWLGTDIGIRNYRFFFSFLISFFLNGIFLMIASVLVIVEIIQVKKSTIKSHVLTILGSVFIFFIAALFVIVVSRLIKLHIKLISRNLTTREFYKGAGIENNPFDKGCCANWKEKFCTKIPPKDFSFRDFVTEKELKSFHFQLTETQKGFSGSLKAKKKIEEKYSELTNSYQIEIESIPTAEWIPLDLVHEWNNTEDEAFQEIR
ncbi:protein s-acyltransferase 8 [Anaeramoeba ignava]|uniref:Palmitoyltransferase n=1 Tax=Anaeramoeba ignava TaxID=1746090 RepID=A0A9Q0LD71_ANAIG|nr:protein s-acyltransferase 8 [Anaeramoeba ignava]